MEDNNSLKCHRETNYSLAEEIFYGQIVNSSNGLFILSSHYYRHMVQVEKHLDSCILRGFM